MSEISKNFIEAWKPLFDKYSELESIPVYVWGRYYKYECRGEKFEYILGEDYDSNDENMVSDMAYNFGLSNNYIDPIYETITKEVGADICRGNIGDYYPDYYDLVKKYGGDSGGGTCIIIRRNSNDSDLLELVFESCDSPE